MATTFNTVADTTNIVVTNNNEQPVMQADPTNIGRLAMVDRDGRTCYGMVDSVCLIGDDMVYGFVTTWAETWCGCLVRADRVTWCETPEQKRLAMTAVENYVTREAESLKRAIARAMAQQNEAAQRRAEDMLAATNNLLKYIIK